MKFILTLLSLIGLIFADEESAKVVFDLTSGNMKTFEKHILKGVSVHKTNYENSFKELEVAVVIHGEAYRFFLNDIKSTKYKSDTKLVQEYATLKKRVASIAETYEVKFYMCKAAMPRHKLEPEDIVEFVQLVPNSTMALIDRQNEGFAYLPVRDYN